MCVGRNGRMAEPLNLIWDGKIRHETNLPSIYIHMVQPGKKPKTRGAVLDNHYSRRSPSSSKITGSDSREHAASVSFLDNL